MSLGLNDKMISNATGLYTYRHLKIRFSPQSLVDRISLYNFWWPKTQSSYSFGFCFQMFCHYWRDSVVAPLARS